MLFQVARVNPFFDESKKVMAPVSSSPYDRRISELRRRTRHKVRRRLLDSLASKNVQYAKIVSILDWVSALFRECERLHTHGAVPLAYARSLGPDRTIKRYMELALASCDEHGYPDFIVDGATLHVPQMRHNKDDMARAEAKWERERALVRERKRRQRARQSADRTPHRSPQKVPSEAICEMSRSDSSLREEDLKQDKDKSFDQLLEEAAARAEAVEHECSQGQEVEAAPMTSAQITEAAYREIEAERERVPARTLVAVPPLRGQLTKWGYRADLAARHRFTDNELALAVEKVERARTPLHNRAGAVVATILRWRTGKWERVAA